MRKILNIAHHRNGVGGNSFYVVSFRDGRQKMIGVVFEERGNVAVFDPALLAEGVIAFGENSYRGDDYETFLRAATAQYDDKLREANTLDRVATVMRGGPKVWAKSLTTQPKESRP